MSRGKACGAARITWVEGRAVVRAGGLATNEWFSHRRHRWHVPLLFECEKNAHLPYPETARRPAHTVAQWAALGTSVSSHSRSRLCRVQ